MKTLYFTNKKGCYYFSAPILVDTENNKLSIFENENSHITGIYVADEPVEIRYEFKGKTYLKKADKGDIIVTFFTKTTYDIIPIVVVKNNDWKTNIVNEKAAIEAARAKDTVKASYDL